MYLEYYNISKKPFQLSADPSFLWLSKKHKEGLAVLKYGLMANNGFTILTGDVGIGKTTLAKAFMNNIGSETLFANISNPDLKRIEFFNLLGATFKFGGKFSGKDDFLIAFQAFLEKCHRDGKQVLLIIDEAQRLDRIQLEEIRLLSNIELKNDNLLNIFFIGQNELIGNLERHENRAILQRMSLIHHLEPLSDNETYDYIHHRLYVAGTEKRIFTQQAIREIYAFSRGNPRIINNICDHAMLTGYVRQKKAISAPEIIECAGELRLKRKWEPESSHGVKTPVMMWKNETAWSKKSRLNFNYLSYIAVVIFLFLFFGFFYFPYRTGAYLSGIMPYWKGKFFESGSTVSKQIPAQPSPQATIIKITEDAGTPRDLEAGRLESENAIRLEVQE